MIPGTKKPDDWIEELRIIDAEGKKPEGAENESVEQLSSAGRIVLNKCELLLTGRLQTEITNGENCLDVESAEKLKECRGDQTALSMKKVWMNLHSLRSRIVSMHQPTRAHHPDQFLQGWFEGIAEHVSVLSGESVGKETDFL